jgi:hypothetical protein
MDNNYFGNICYCRKCNGIVHTIKKGDSLYLLSRYYHVPIGEIMNANRNLNVYNLQIGEEICIPMRRSDMMNDTDIEEDTSSDMEASSISTEEAGTLSSEFEPDLNTHLSEILSREDMTWGKFLNLVQKS